MLNLPVGDPEKSEPVPQPSCDDDLPPELRLQPTPPRNLAPKFISLFCIVILVGFALRPVVFWLASFGRGPDDADQLVHDEWRVEQQGEWQHDYRNRYPHWFDSVAFANLDSIRRIEFSPQGSIKRIYLPNGTAVTDAWMSNLRSLNLLEELNLERTTISDMGLVSLQQLPKLEELRLDASNITGLGFRPPGFTALRILSLKSCPVNDVGLKPIGAIRSLEVLILSDTQVTDAGLVNLTSLSALKDLDLAGTKVTAAGVQTLQRALPICRIRADHLRLD